MLSSESKRVADKAKALYDEKFRAILEASHHGDFVCIEPESGTFFLGKTFDAAVNNAIDAYPNRLTHTLRIGHAAALRLEKVNLSKVPTVEQVEVAHTGRTRSRKFG